MDSVDRVPDDPTTDEGEPDAVRVYWRPGCGFCSSLRRGLDRAGLATVDLNIWDDPEHAAFVRRHADGNETVPTVAVGDVVLVNPPAAAVLDLAAEAGIAWAPPAPRPGLGSKVRNAWHRG